MPMLAPQPAIVPSESTIEQLSNHQLLSLVSPYGTWFYVPTRREEKRLRFDASLQGLKALVIQYKRLKATSAPTVLLNAAQLHDLQAKYRPRRVPYAFIAFSHIANYAQLSQLFESGHGFVFGLMVHFVDIHSIPSTARSLVMSTPCQIIARDAGRAGRRYPVAHETLWSLVARFASCTVGLPAEEVEEVGEPERGDTVPLPHLNILWARP